MKCVLKKPFIFNSEARLGPVIAVTIFFVIVVGLATYLLISGYVLKQAEGNIRDMMQSHRGLHQYIQKVMHPTFYAARNAGEVKEDYYAPQIFSSTYVVRVMHGFTNEERKNAGLPEVYYKMATTNPRNPVNMADEREAQLLIQFNNHRELKEYREVVTVNDKKFLYYAVPFIETGQACLKCHGKREDAPLGLQNCILAREGSTKKQG